MPGGHRVARHPPQPERTGVDWVKLAQRYYLDPAIRGVDGDLGDAAEVMFTRGLARAGEVGQHGFIPEQDVALLTRRRRYAAVVRVLTQSGLWTVVPGGYQIARWSDWQDHLDALTRKRAADRDRQRRRRAAAHNGSPLSRDPSRDVTAVEGEGEREKEGGYSSVGKSPPSTGDPQPPPQTCNRHPDGTDDPCRSCQRAREAHQQWQADQAAVRAEREQLRRQQPRCRCGTKHLPDETCQEAP